MLSCYQFMCDPILYTVGPGSVLFLVRHGAVLSHLGC